MNLRLSENSFRFRVTPEDLDILLQGQGVGQKVFLGKESFEYMISPVLAGEMNLEIESAKFNLSVPHQVLEELRDLGRSKEGVSVVQGDVGISLQLDIKTQKRKAA